MYDSPIYQAMFDELEKVNGFKHHMPYLMSELKKAEVWCWDSYGIPSTLTESHRAKIHKMLKDDGLYCYAVLEYNAQTPYGDEETLHMTSYLVLKPKSMYDPDDDDDYLPDDYVTNSYTRHNVFYAMSITVNHTWDLEDWGDIAITSTITGGPVRMF